MWSGAAFRSVCRSSVGSRRAIPSRWTSEERSGASCSPAVQVTRRCWSLLSNTGESRSGVATGSQSTQVCIDLTVFSRNSVPCGNCQTRNTPIVKVHIIPRAGSAKTCYSRNNWPGSVGRIFVVIQSISSAGSCDFHLFEVTDGFLVVT